LLYGNNLNRGQVQSMLLLAELLDGACGIVRLTVALGATTTSDLQKLFISVMSASLLEDDVPVVGSSSLDSGKFLQSGQVYTFLSLSPHSTLTGF